MNYEVIIVGAGASGLMAAKELSKARKKVLVLEARNRIGGRIFPLPEEEFGYPAQGGAEFVHGEAPVTRQLIDEAGLTLIHPVPWWDMKDDAVKVVTDPITLHGGLVQQKLDALREDETIFTFMEREFPEEQYLALRDMTYRRAEGYDAADPKRMSAFAMREEFNNENNWVQKNLQEGYGALIRFLEKKAREQGADIRLDTRVMKIEHSAEGVVATSESGERFEAKKVLVTVPLPLISKIDFSPAIQEKLNAAEQIGYGPVIKTLIRFKEKWWMGNRERHFDRMFFLFSSEKIPTWWTQYPETHTTLTGWVAGPKAHALAGNSEEELLQIALQSLSNIFQISLEELRSQIAASEVMNWEKDPLSLGAYSYVTPETERAVGILGEPVHRALYFAGEVFGGDANATVEGALASGLEAAKQMFT